MLCQLCFCTFLIFTAGSAASNNNPEAIDVSDNGELGIGDQFFLGHRGSYGILSRLKFPPAPAPHEKPSPPTSHLQPIIIFIDQNEKMYIPVEDLTPVVNLPSPREFLPFLKKYLPPSTPILSEFIEQFLYSPDYINIFPPMQFQPYSNILEFMHDFIDRSLKNRNIASNMILKAALTTLKYLVPTN